MNSTRSIELDFPDPEALLTGTNQTEETATRERETILNLKQKIYDQITAKLDTLTYISGVMEYHPDSAHPGSGEWKTVDPKNIVKDIINSVDQDIKGERVLNLKQKIYEQIAAKLSKLLFWGGGPMEYHPDSEHPGSGEWKGVDLKSIVKGSINSVDQDIKID